MKRCAIIFMMIGLIYANPALADDDHYRFPMDLHDLGLTSKQHKAVEAAMKEYRQAYRMVHDKNEKIQSDMNTLFMQPTFDAKAFQIKQAEKAAISAQIQSRFYERLHTILTPEQKRRFIQHAEELDNE